jgi:hypothetical protein
MDWVSLFLSLVGIGRDSANRANDRRAEIARLNAEAAGDAGKALDILNAAKLRLLGRCASVYPGNAEMLDVCHKTLDPQINLLEQNIAMTQDLSQKIASGSWGSDWDLALQRAYEMRATATRFVPFAENIVSRMDQAIDADAVLLHGSGLWG